MGQLIEPHLESMQAYLPGLSISAMKKKYGRDNFVKLASNEGAFGPSPMVAEALSRASQYIHRYPVELRNAVKEQISKYISVPGINDRHIVLGNGSNELITLLSRIFLGSDGILLNAWPSFMAYRLSATAMNREQINAPLDSNLHYDLERMAKLANGPKSKQIKLLFLGNPNNPTGHYIGQSDLSQFIEALPEHIVLVVDEAYFEYVKKDDYGTSISWVLKRPRTVILRTFSKIFGLAGLRVGYAVCDPEIADVLRKIRDPFNVNSLAQEAAIVSLQDGAHVALGRANNTSQLKRMSSALGEMGLWASESVGNFFLFRLNESMPSAEIMSQEFLKRGVIIRLVSNYDLSRYLRVTIGRPAENDIFLSALSDILNHI